jgi:hypothetical protein
MVSRQTNHHALIISAHTHSSTHKALGHTRGRGRPACEPLILEEMNSECIM